MDITEKPQLNPSSTVDQQELLGSIVGHAIAIKPASDVAAGFERLQRIYSDGDAVKVTGNMKIIQP